MPFWMRRYLAGHDIRAHFWRALAIGFFLRLLSAWFVFGPQALDDYKHGVWPAYQFFAQIPLDLPGYRSHLLVWYLSVFVEVASWFGGTSALAQVRAMYMGLGLTSLLGIYGTYLYARGINSRLFGPLALYLVAAFPLMPFISTRAFGEAVAMSLVLLAFGILESARRERRRDESGHWFLGFFTLGIATLFRFHCGLLYFGYGGVLLYQKRGRAVGAGIVAGLVTLGLQAAIDLASGKGPLGTLITYLKENEGGAVKYGVSAWYNPLLLVLGLTLFPFAPTFVKSARGLWRRDWPWLVPFLVFLAAHCMVPHKEERFLYPILGIEMWAIAYLWAANARRKWVRKIYAPVFLGACLLFMPFVTLVNTQAGEVEPPAYVESHYGPVAYIDHESLFGRSRFQDFFLRPPALIEKVERGDLGAHRIDSLLADHPDLNAAVLLTSVPEVRAQLAALEGLTTMESACGEVRTGASLADRVVFALLAKQNQRRKPTWYLICERVKRT